MRRTFANKWAALVLAGCLFIPQLDGQTVLPNRRRNFKPAPPPAGGCTVASGNVFNESFEGTGYENASWTETGTPDEDAALLGTSPCSGLGSQAFTCVYPTAGTRQWIKRDLGASSQVTAWFRFYFYVSSESLASTDRTTLFSLSEIDFGNEALGIEVRDNAGQLTVRAGGTTSSTAQDISLGTWYRAEAKWVYNSASGSIFRLYNAAGTQIGTDATFTTTTNERRYMGLGIVTGDNTQAITAQFDGFGVSTVDWLGQ